MKARFIDLQKSRLIKGEISRRQFIRSALASGVGVTGAMTLANAAEAQRPARGGDLRLALRGLDLPFAFGSALTELQPDGSLTGELAESWHSNPEATLWRFTVRGDAVFHSGAAVTAADVVDVLLGAQDDLLAGLLEARADEQDVVLEFADAVPDLPLWLSDPALVIQAGGFGSGPYVPGIAGRAERFGHWFKPERAHFDALILSEDGSLDDLMAGRLDVLAAATTGECNAARALGLIVEDHAGLTRLVAGGRLIAGRPSPDWEVRAGIPEGQPVSDKMILRPGLLHDGIVARHAPLDGGRLAERWWFA